MGISKSSFIQSKNRRLYRTIGSNKYFTLTENNFIFVRLRSLNSSVFKEKKSTQLWLLNAYTVYHFQDRRIKQNILTRVYGYSDQIIMIGVGQGVFQYFPWWTQNQFLSVEKTNYDHAYVSINYLALYPAMLHIFQHLTKVLRESVLSQIPPHVTVTWKTVIFLGNLWSLGLQICEYLC